MPEFPKHYDLGDALARINDRGELTIVQMDNPMGMVKLRKPETDRLIECLLERAGYSGATMSEDASAIVTDLRARLAQAHADNDLAQQEIARLSEKPKRGRPKKEADAPPAEWDAVPSEPVTDQGAQADHLPGFAVGDQVETVATGELGVVERLFPDNPRKVQAAINGRPHVFDVTMLKLVAPMPSLPIPQGSDLAPEGSELAPHGSELDVPELISGLEAAGLTVMTEVPEVVTTQMDPEKLRQALYADVKLYEFTPDEMRALIAEVVGEPKSSKELDAQQLGAVLRAMHERGAQSRLPF